MEVVIDFWREEPPESEDYGPVVIERRNVPAVFRLICVQCRAMQTLTLFSGPREIELVVLQSSYGGLSTSHCPESVAYYLDQAHRAETMGAMSAAVSMYRAALEQLLYEQGFAGGGLAAQIRKATEADPEPQWLRNLHPEFLDVLKDLGNGAIHPNDGDIERQSVLDAVLMRQVRELFIEMLDEVYEMPHRRAERLEAMRAAREALTITAA